MSRTRWCSGRTEQIAHPILWTPHLTVLCILIGLETRKFVDLASVQESNADLHKPQKKLGTERHSRLNIF